jgi:hypothetical protein
MLGPLAFLMFLVTGVVIDQGAATQGQPRMPFSLDFPSKP